MNTWWENESLIKFETPTSIFIVAPSGGGKTELTKQILKHVNGVFNTPTSKIYFCYSIWQKLYTDMQNEIKNIHFYEGLPSMTEINDWGAEEGHKILVLDDLVIKGGNSEELVHMMCVARYRKPPTEKENMIKNKQDGGEVTITPPSTNTPRKDTTHKPMNKNTRFTRSGA
ncbi:unnamed protein product [Mytilus coruscus]|uniref:Uncharacterized protein n=1 Tax=Mytilus coruscus TaxID=42192 RepID=A0A6J8F1E3_MYTCO|nr:unnamed protein product [Mytilus coruscus]